MDTPSFNSLWATSQSKIIKFICGDCNSDRGENVYYYKRLYPSLPEGFDMMKYVPEHTPGTFFFFGSPQPQI